MKRLCFVLPLLVLSLGAASLRSEVQRYLLLDDRVVASTGGVTLRVGTVKKHAANPLFGEDQPWEVRFDNLYPNIVFDEERQLYRCWYSPFIVDPSTAETPRSNRTEAKYRPHDREMGICYAESKDGVHWTKPRLGRIEFGGNKDNNLVLRDPHGAGVTYDPADPDPSRRFKLFCRISDKEKVMGVAFSADGLQWSPLQPCPEIEVPGDTHNNAFFAPELQRYVGITRLRTDQRLVARTESPDFRHWTKAVEVLRADAKHQAYAMPVLRHAGVYLGFVMVFDTATDRVSCELAWSPDTLRWQRIDPGHALIPNSERAGDYDWGCVYTAVPILRPNEIQLYYGASNGPHTGWRDGFLALATLRPDGFAGFATNAPGQAGNVRTVPLTCSGLSLRLSADVARGHVRVTLLDEQGRERLHSQEINADVTDAPIKWREAADLQEFAGRRVQLRFDLVDAKLYSFTFSN